MAKWIMHILFLAGAAQMTCAQSPTGSISGAVTDMSGAVVAGATVTITNTETGAVRTLISNRAGKFRTGER